jgi:heme exporter protein C
LTVTLLAALGLYSLFYAPTITQGVRSGSLPASGALWLQLHIAAYSLSYSLFFTGLLLAVTFWLGQSTTRLPWVEAATVVAAFLALLGLLAGMLAAKPMWGGWWVWDAKHTSVLLATVTLVGVSPMAALTRLVSNPSHRQVALVVLLVIAVVACAGSFLVGAAFTRVVHPRWFPEILFR